MNINPFTWDTDQWQAFGKHFASAAAGGVGVLVATHLLSPSQGSDLGENVNHVINGLQEVAKGLTGIIAAVTLAYTSLRAAKTASPEAKKESVAQQPNKLVVTASPGTNLISLANKIAAMPESHEVMSTPAVAAATPSDKVIAPTANPPVPPKQG